MYADDLVLSMSSFLQKMIQVCETEAISTDIILIHLSL